MEIIVGFFLVVLSYLIGCFNTAYIFSTKLKKTDIRSYGSGNAGATNILRTFGLSSAVLVFLGDAFKGILALIIANYLSNGNPLIIILCAISCVAGHNWPVFLNYRGGKGVATTIGILFYVDPKIALIAIVIGVVVVLLSKIVALGSLIGVYTAFVCNIIFNQPIYYIALTFLLAIITTYQHRGNIVRIIRKEENKISFSKKK